MEKLIYVIVRQPSYFGAKKQILMRCTTLENAMTELDNFFCKYCASDEGKISELEFMSRGISYFIECEKEV